MTAHQEPVRLSAATLDALPETLERPAYDRKAAGIGTVHLGVGGFHRAHQLVYTNDVLARRPGDWACCGVGLMSADRGMRDALVPQDGLYTVVSRSARGDKARVIGAMKEYLPGYEDPGPVLERMANPATRIVSLTVTEKGYCQSPDGNLDLQHPMIRHDISRIEEPRSAPGYLVAGLRRRFQGGSPPFTVMSCDNLPGNGDITRRLVLQLAAEIDGRLQNWIEQHTAFPNSMVDRITPATTEEDRRLVAEEFGVLDAWPVVCEEFSQWVIEDRFCAGRPVWEEAGAQFVPQVHPYEVMKVRLLNGSHSILSYPAYLLGHREVNAAMGDPLISGFIRACMDEEIGGTVPPVPEINLESYKTTLMDRFANPAIQDKVQRLAEDGSRKIPNAVLPCIRERLAAGQGIALTALAIACWIRYLAGEDEQGQPIVITDPLAETLTQKARQEGPDPRPFLSVEAVFGADLSRDETFASAVGEALAALYAHGTAPALQDWTAAAKP